MLEKLSEAAAEIIKNRLESEEGKEMSEMIEGISLAEKYHLPVRGKKRLYTPIYATIYGAYEEKIEVATFKGYIEKFAESRAEELLYYPTPAQLKKLKRAREEYGNVIIRAGEETNLPVTIIGPEGVFNLHF